MNWKLLSINPKQATILGTVLVLIMLGAGYFLYYVPNNQHELEAKQFRCLQNVEKNVSDKIDNSLSLLTTLLEDYIDNKPTYDSNAVSKYVNDYPKTNFTLSPITPIKPSKKNRHGYYRY